MYMGPRLHSYVLPIGPQRHPFITQQGYFVRPLGHAGFLYAKKGPQLGYEGFPVGSQEPLYLEAEVPCQAIMPPFWAIKAPW